MANVKESTIETIFPFFLISEKHQATLRVCITMGCRERQPVRYDFLTLRTLGEGTENG